MGVGRGRLCPPHSPGKGHSNCRAWGQGRGTRGCCYWLPTPSLSGHLWDLSLPPKACPICLASLGLGGGLQGFWTGCGVPIWSTKAGDPSATETPCLLSLHSPAENKIHKPTLPGPAQSRDPGQEEHGWAARQHPQPHYPEAARVPWAGQSGWGGDRKPRGLHTQGACFYSPFLGTSPGRNQGIRQDFGLGWEQVTGPATSSDKYRMRSC